MGLIALFATTILLIATSFVFAAQTTIVFVAPTNTSELLAHGVSRNPWDAASQTFDYVVVGGGLTGITVAARLAENPSVSVLVIEAGQDKRCDQRIQDIYEYKNVFNSELDWAWPMMYHNRKITGGKTLGGSSSINGAAWTRGLDSGYDAWSQLLEQNERNLDWSWESMFYYMKKSETWSRPNDQQRKKGADDNDAYHGYNGPVQVTFPDAMYGGPQQPAFVQTIQSLTGIAKCPDINGGRPNCVAYTPLNLNWHNKGYRSTSAAAYLTPVEGKRTNWLTLVNHQVTKINWANGGTKKTAVSVNFKQADNTGQTYTVNARKEVILAAGAIMTPALLQLSGVGDPARLNPLGIQTVIDLPTVGKNLQEQTMSALGADGNGFDVGGRGPSNVIAFLNINELYGTKAQDAINDINDNYKKWAQDQAAHGASAAALTTIFGIQKDLIIHKKAPIAELFYDTGHPKTIGVDAWPLLPFSRGTVHIRNNDPFTYPEINVNPFNVERDMLTQMTMTRLIRRLFKTPPLSNLSKGESEPGFDRVPDDGNGGSYEKWHSWIWDKFMAVSHPVATCAMMRRDLGGVVDGRLRLYDSTNVRIVDASVMPTQVSAHLSTTLYAIAEKVADMIKNNV